MASSVPNNMAEELSDTEKERAPTTVYRCHSRRRAWMRRRKLQTVRLGGKKPRRGFICTRVFRRIRLKWLKMKRSCTLKKLKEYYHSLLKDMMEAGAALEAYQQRLLRETSFAVPVMGLSFNTFHNSYA